MQDLSVFCLKAGFFFDISLRVLRESINSPISFVLVIINLRMIPQQLLSPLDLSRTQVFDVYKMVEIVIICENKNLISAIFQLMSPDLEDPNNS